jgi:hypothetical protein
MQEVKASPDQVDPSTWRDLGYQEHWHAASRPGYSGALLLYRPTLDGIRAGLGIEDIDVEGRVIEADLGRLTLLTAYFPNGGKKGDRLPFKYAFYGAFLDRVNAIRAEILAFMRQAVRELGQTIVMVTHDPVAASFASRVVLLADGRIVDEIHDPTPDSVLDRMKNLR